MLCEIINEVGAPGSPIGSYCKQNPTFPYIILMDSNLHTLKKIRQLQKLFYLSTQPFLCWP